MNPERIVNALNRNPILSHFETSEQIDSELQQLTKKQSDIQKTIQNALSDALSEICSDGKYGLIERVAFSAVFDEFNNAKNIDDLVGGVNSTFDRLLSINQVLRGASPPLLAYTVCRLPKKGDLRPNHLIEYSYRNGDGSGLVIDERTVVYDSKTKYIHDIYIPEIELTGKFARGFGLNYRDEPIVFAHTPGKFMSWASGPDTAASDLAEPPRHSRTTHLLIGKDEVDAFFDTCVPSEQYDALYGHAALMGFHFGSS